MRVALVNNLFVDQLGYYYISAALKAAGHDVRFFISSRHLERELRAFDPQLLGLTAVTGNHVWATDIASEIKQFLPQVKTILGGPHPTYHPQIIKHPSLDYVCRGEGELAIVQLCDRMERGEDTTNIPGIWAALDGNIYENAFGQLVEDLDSIPFPDRSIYDRFALTRKNLFPFMLSSRGCPFQCTFCYAPTMAGLVKGKGKFVRFRSVDNVIAEAQALTQRFRIQSIEFVDDIFGMHRPWLREFAQRWRSEVGIPFQCNLRADLVTDETVDLLRDAGCRAIGFGIEAGNPRVRNDILKKEVSNEQIIAAGELIHRKKMKLFTYNILGAPTETLEEAFDTLYINQKVKPSYAMASIMMPFPGTKVYDLAVAEGNFQSDAFGSMEPFFWGSSPMKLDHGREIVNLQKFFYLAVRYPRLTPLIRRLIKLPTNVAYYGIYLAFHVYFYWYRTKSVPSTFLLHLLLNVTEIWRRHKSGLYKQRLPLRDDLTSIKERIEVGAV